MITRKKGIILSKAFTAGTTVSSLFKMNKTVFAESGNILDIDLVDENYEKDNCQSKSEFIQKAIQFYCGFLRNNDNSQYLSTVLMSTMEALFRESDNRISKLIFKLAVELAITMNVVAFKSGVDKYFLAKEYLSGESIPRNPDAAVQLLEELSADNFENAEYLLGKLYYQGEVIPQNVNKAVFHLERAFESDNEYAAYQLGKIYLKENHDTDKAIFYFKAAAKKGNAYAQYQLGKIYLYGNGVEKDVELAYEYLIESSKNGNPYALQLMNSHSKGRSPSTAMCSLSLLHHLSRIIQNQIEQNRRRGRIKTERKTRQKIDDKKFGLGLR